MAYRIEGSCVIGTPEPKLPPLTSQTWNEKYGLTPTTLGQITVSEQYAADHAMDARIIS